MQRNKASGLFYEAVIYCRNDLIPMMAQGISVQQLLAGAEDRLGIRQVIAADGLANRLRRVSVQSRGCGDIGSSLRRNVPLILTPDHGHALIGETWEPHPAFLKEICTAKVPCIFLSASMCAGERLLRLSEQAGIPLMSCAHEAVVLESRLQGLLREKIRHHIVVHGVLLKMFGLGVLIQGNSGVGKTTLGVMLAKRGHGWIADDAIEIKKMQGKRLYARGCEAIRGLIDMKESGIRNARSIFAGRRPEAGTELHLILKIGGIDASIKDEKDQDVKQIMGMQVPGLQIPFSGEYDFDIMKIEKNIRDFMKNRGRS